VTLRCLTLGCQTLIELLHDERSNRTSLNCRSRFNHFCSKESENLISKVQERGNPFLLTPSAAFDEQGCSLMTISSIAESNSNMKEIYSLLKSYLGSCDPRSSNVVPQCFTVGLLKWVSRLLMIIEKLPPIAEDACKVFANIFDLYTTTIFRVCAGSSKHERLLLGLEEPYTNVSIEHTTRAHESSSPLFGFGRRPASNQKPTRTAPTLSAYTDAELCAPLPCEMDGLGSSRDLICQAQESLKGIAKLDLVDGWVADPDPAQSTNLADLVCKSARILEKRQAALWSCVFVAMALQIASVKAKRSFVITDRNYGSSLDNLDTYVQSFCESAPRLVSLSNRISCMRAIRGSTVVQQVSKIRCSIC
jgi:hypothetical protein